ncbi:MAG TPA: hypothetical protein VM187_00195 [Niastella sp.]|nr:hypothetical protein [Niastella sp.]
MKTLCIRRFLWVFSVLFTQQVVQAQTDSSAKQTPVTPPAVTTTSSFTTPLITIENGKTKKPKIKKKWHFAIDADAGFASPANTELSDVFKGGLNASIGFKTSFFDNRLWVRPVAGLKYYWKKVNLGETQREAFRTWKGGIELQYKVYTLGKFAIVPLLRVDQNMSSSQFTRINDEKTETEGIKTTGKLLTGSGISFDAGVMLVRSGDLYVKLDYEYYKPDLEVNPDYVAEMLARGILMPANKVYDCSSINLSVGVNLNFKK